MTTAYDLEGEKRRGRPLAVLGLVVLCFVVAVNSSSAIVIDMQMAEIDRSRLQINQQTPCRSSCQFDQPFNETTCRCMCGDGFRGYFCEFPPRDCSDFYERTGYKWIYLPETDVKLRVVCTSGWMYILQFNESSDAFKTYGNASWNVFRSGFNFFGSKRYWIGHDIIHKITTKNNHAYKLMLTVKKAPIWLTSFYYDFYLGDEASNYTIYFSGSQIPRRGSETLEVNSQFRTTNYNSNDCTTRYGAAWWYQQECPLPSILGRKYAIDGIVNDIYDFVLSLQRQ